ncbi:TonB-dependent hemoglobin/transferrin/lactoferrin family receptor [Variovorax saccharolyticus]|uniref:TonB-dependent hemoglobin/transferrin/lactoferrin family receptor n=1 Tax=Variovorax saccharolyticus TaxID=3053516 RepID=UPI002577BC0F|nr:TonB-dependent hemoglobin/transferrin/lactoferrin family receptor [Variovorax sp. J31P216]MDM0023104.1 TonB-dependent hemoglobin/transferrin/lactoferrin family receptor [Variovorax sp. J31P216]
MSRSNAFSHRLRLLPWLIASAFSTHSLAQEAGPARIAALGEIVVSGTRSEQSRDDIPATVEVIDRQQIEFEQIHDIRDAVRDIPNVSVRRAPARFGLATGNTGRDANAGFNIRGLDGNRVLLMTDGIRMPRSYVFSANAFGRDYFDLGLIERIEIIKGPVSALYGSDGLAGLVNFITRQPESFLADGKTFGGSANVGYSGDNNGWQGGVTMAGKASDTVSWLISANGSRTHELENMGTNYAHNSDRTAPNPELSNTQSLLAKVVVTPNADLTHNLTFEHVARSTGYDLLSGISKPPLTATSVIGLGALTNLQRDRLTWDGRLRVNSVLADNVLGYLSYQKADSREQAWETRYRSATRMRDVDYSENTWQAGLQADKTLRMSGDWSQRITYGFDYTNTQVENLQTGLVPPVGEVYPLKRFPDTTEKTAAFYIQDEFIHDQWSITPGVRFDHFDIDADQAGFTPRAVSLSDSAVSPKLGVLFRATPQWTLYGNYAAGFKAPNAFQVNNFFENVVSGYRTIPNPNLKPETSQNFELGTRGRVGILNFEAAVFTGTYDDMIENDRQVSGVFGSRTNPATFQSVNIGRARIDGFEFKGELDWTREGTGFSLPFAYGRTNGEDRTANVPLNSVEPEKFVAGLKYQAPTWTVRLDAVHYAAKKRSDVDPAEVTTGVQFLTPSATTLDLNAQWRIRRDLRLNVALINVTDKKYWMWSDVRGLAASSPVVDAYTQPGRHFNVSLVADF